MDLTKKRETLLVINSYSETDPWSRAIVEPVLYYVATNDDVHAEMYSLNNVLVTDSATYETVKKNMFDKYDHDKPQYLVMVGNLAFSFLPDIKARWGNLPLLLITRDLNLAPANNYFSGYDLPLLERNESLLSLRDEYDFTVIYMPNLYKRTIDMIDSMIGGMDELIFFSDPLYLNRYMANDIELYLYEEYPNVKFTWVQASDDRPDELQYFLMNRMEHTGMLISTWFYEKSGPFGYPTVGFGDLSLLQSSVNPVFSLRSSYILLGSIGGVYPDMVKVKAEVNEVLSKMVAGESMSQLPVYMHQHDSSPIVNYPLLAEYKISESKCPDNTVFLDKPQSLWQRYSGIVMAAIAVLFLLFVLYTHSILRQRHKSELLDQKQRFVNMMPVPYSKAKVIYDDMGKIVNVRYDVINEAFLEILKANAYSVDPYMIFPTDFIAGKTAEMLETGGPVIFDYHFEKTDTYYIFTVCDVDSGHKKNKKTAAKYANTVDIFAVDITDNRKNEQSLKLMSRRLDNTINAAKLIPWELDVDDDVFEFDTYSLFHRVGKDLLSKELPETRTTLITHLDFLQLIHPDDVPMLIKLREDILLRRLKESNVTFRMKLARGGHNVIEWVEMTAMVTVTDRNNNPKRIVGSLKVVTDEKNQELALIAAKEKASESDKMKSAFLANMSHEIRTPLNAIVGFSGLLCETDDLERRREFSAIINQNNDALLSLINDVLDLAKIESNTIDICEAPVDINSMLITCRDTVKLRLYEGVKLNMTPGAAQCVAMTDGTRLSQVLMNLLANATKFTKSGCITYGYDILDGKELYFYVRDTGIGISEENQKRLFKRFDKIDNFSQGNGLGLAICKSLVELFGGSIGVKSHGEGKGSTFWFTVPYKPAADADMSKAVYLANVAGTYKDIEMSAKPAEQHVPEHKKEEVEPVEERSADTSGSEHRKLILVAEDIDGNYQLLKHIIPKDYDLIHAWDGAEAVDMFFKNHPDLVLMDINMPVLDGYQATEAIRKVNEHVPIIAITAYTYASDRKRILQSGFNDYISKPVMRSDLLDALLRNLKH